MAEKVGKDGLTNTQRYRARHRAERNAASNQYKREHPEIAREWRRKSYHRNADQVRYYWINRKYGLTREQYDAMVRDQDGKCVICGIDFSELKRRPAVDHDHATGMVRAILCNLCNVRVGIVETEIAWRDGVLAYIAKHRKVG